MAGKTDQKIHNRDRRDDQKFAIRRTLMDLDLAELKAKQIQARQKNELTSSLVELIRDAIERLEKIY